MSWSGLVSRVGASHRVNLITPFPARTDLPKENEYRIINLPEKRSGNKDLRSQNHTGDLRPTELRQGSYSFKP